MGKQELRSMPQKAYNIKHRDLVTHIFTSSMKAISNNRCWRADLKSIATSILKQLCTIVSYNQLYDFMHDEQIFIVASRRD